MRLEDVESLAALISRHGLTKLEISEKGFHILLERGTAAAALAPERAASESTPPRKAPAPADIPPAATAPDPGLYCQKAPLVGTVYLAPAEDARPYAQKGDAVKKGDTVCILEAMKVMNEIAAETDGVVEEVRVSNGQPVEFGQPLFFIRRSAWV